MAVIKKRGYTSFKAGQKQFPKSSNFKKRKTFIPRAIGGMYAGQTGASNNVEVKCYDRVLGQAAAVLVTLSNVVGIDPTAGNPTFGIATGLAQVNPLISGTQGYQRIGTRITMKSVAINFDLAANSLAIGDVATVRMLLIYDKSTNGSFPLYTDILQSIDGVGNVTNAITSGVKIANSKRFIFIRDKFIVLDPAQSTLVHVHDYVKLKNLVTEYGGSTSPGAVGDCTSGGLFLMIFYAYAGTAPKMANVVARLRYYD